MPTIADPTTTQPPSFTGEELAHIVDLPDFQSAPLEVRREFIQTALPSAFQTEQQTSEWTPERQRGWGEFASYVQSKAQPTTGEQIGQFVQDFGQAAVGAVKGIPGMVADTALALGSKLLGGGTDNAYADEQRRRGETPDTNSLAEAYDEAAQAQTAKTLGLVQRATGLLTQEEEGRRLGLAALREQIDAGQVPLNDAQAFSQWKAQWAQDLPFLAAQETQNALDQFLATRSPDAWQSLNREASSTAKDKSGEARLNAVMKSPAVQSLHPYLQEQFPSAADPLQIATMVVPVEGVLGKATGNALARVGTHALSGGALGTALHARDNPGASLTESVTRGGLPFAALSGAMTTLGEMRSAPREAPGSGSQPPPPSEPTAPRPAGWDGGMVDVPIDPALLRDGMEGATDGDFAKLDEQFTPATRATDPPATAPADTIQTPPAPETPGPAPTTDRLPSVENASTPETPPAAPAQAPYQGVDVGEVGTKFDPTKKRTWAPPAIPDNPLGRGSIDVLDFLNENPLQKAGTSKEGGFDRLRTEDVPRYWGKFIYGKNGIGYPPDELAMMAHREGLISDSTPDALASAVHDAIKARQTYRASIVKGKSMEREQINQHKRFENAKTSGEQPVEAATLEVGDKLVLNDHPLEVIRVDFDEDGYTTGVQVKDGPTYGIQHLSGNEVLLVDEFKPKARKGPSTDFLPEDPFSLTSATPDELRAESKAASDTQTMRDRAARPLTGGTGDIFTPDMLDPTSGETPLFTFQAAREWADKTIKDKAGQLRTGFDPELIAAYAIKAVGSGVDFATYVAGVVKEFGEGARETARDAWVRVHATMRNDPQDASRAKPLNDALGGAPQDYTAWKAEDMQARADGISAAYSTPELVRALSSDQGLQRMGVDPSLREFMNAEALRRALADVGRATNDVDRIRAQSVLRQARSIYDVSGTEAGQHLASRALAAKDLRAEAPDLAMTDAIEKEQSKVIDPALPVEPATAATGEAAKIAGEIATENLVQKVTRRLTTRDKLLETDSPALARLVNALREKITGLNWRDVFTSSADTQRQWEIETYARIRQHEMLKDLSHDEAVKLTREFSKAWQRERRDVFQSELEKSQLRAGVKPQPLAKVKAASERLLKLINLGALDASSFRDALAKEFGIKDLSAPEIKQVRELAVKYQAAPDGVARRRLGQQIIERMQDVTRLSKAELLESYWTTAVLSGWRTMVDIGLAVANGIEDVGFGGIVTAIRTGNADVALRGVGKLLGNLPRALNEAWHIAVTGDKSIMRNYQQVINDALSDGGRDFASAARQLREKGGLVGKPAGLFMEGMARVLTVLDHINQSSTAAGAKWLAMAEHPELYRKALQVTERDRVLARERALNELTGGAEPKTHAERVQVKARVEEIIDEMVPTEIISEAITIGEDAAMMGEPTGLGGAAVELVRKVVSSPDAWAKNLEKSPKADTALVRAVMRSLRLASTFGRVFTGTKFVRVVGHQVNRSLSYVPGVGLARFAEASMNGVKADVLIAKQLVGLTAGLAVLNWFRSGGKDGDEKRGIEGNWKNLNPEQRSQLYAQGKSPNSIWYRDNAGRVVSFNFQQWGLSGLFAALGAMEDQRRYHGHNKTDATVLLNGLAGGLFAWQDKAQLQGLQTILGESPYASDNIGENFVKRLNKWASMTVGGLVPRVLKDIDLVSSPTLRDSHEWWAQWTGQVPMLRELSTGARVDIFGNDIKQDRGPMSRVWLRGNEGKPYQLLGLLNERDVWLPDPSAAQRVVKTRAGRRPLAREERDRYQRLTGAAYADYIERNGENFVNFIERGGPPEKRNDRVMKIRATISKQTKPLRDRAAQAAVR